MTSWGLYIEVKRNETTCSASLKSVNYLIGWFRGLSMDDSARIEEKLRSIETSARQGQLWAEQVQFRWQKCTAKSLEALDEECTASGDVLGVGEWVEYCRSVQYTLRRFAVNNVNDSLDATWRRWRKAFPVRIKATDQQTYFDPQDAEMFVGITEQGDYYQPYEPTPILYRHDQDYWSLVTVTSNRNDPSEWSATFEKVLDDVEAVRWFFSQGMDLPRGLDEIRRKVAINPFRFPLEDAIPVLPADESTSDAETVHEAGLESDQKEEVADGSTNANESSSPPPPFETTTGNWCDTSDLANLIGTSVPNLQTYRKNAKVNDTDSHGKWGIDCVGAFRRNCDGKRVYYYLPSLSPNYKYRLNRNQSKSEQTATECTEPQLAEVKEQ